MPKTKTKRKVTRQYRRRHRSDEVNFNKNFADFQCIVLTLMGFSRKFVANETGLEPHQCDYRAQLLGIRRTLYRDGLGDIAQATIDTLFDRTEEIIHRYYVTQ